MRPGRSGSGESRDRHRINRVWQRYRESVWGTAPNVRTPQLPPALWFLFATGGWAAALHFRIPEHAAALLGRH
jgi:hypothetical protein